MFYVYVVIIISFLMLIIPTFRLSSKMAAISAASLAENSLLSFEEMPATKKYQRKDRKKRTRSNDSDSDTDGELMSSKIARSQFKISEILKNHQLRSLDNSPDKILKYVPEPVKDVFLPYMNHIKMINLNLNSISSLFKANGQLLRPELVQKFDDLANKTGDNLNKFSGDLVEQLASNYSQDTVYEKIKASCQEPIVNLDKIPVPEEEKPVANAPSNQSNVLDNFDEYMDSDIDLQISEMCDNVTNDVKCNDTVKVPELASNSSTSNDTSKQQNSSNVPKDKHLEGLRYDEDGYLEVYTDGCCLSNGRNNAQAGVGVWFNHNHPLNLAAPASGIPTNNNAEIQAATKAILIASQIDCKKIKICTDSMFLINCMTTWIKNWKKNNWKTAEKQPVKNRESLMELDSSIKLMDSVQWKHIPGHKGCIGNEAADALAKRGAQLYRR